MSDTHEHNRTHLTGAVHSHERGTECGRRIRTQGTSLALAAMVGVCLAAQPAPVFASEPQKAETTDASTTDDAYRLGVSDKLRIQVFEWRPARDELFTWTALNQVYTIDTAGSLSLPLLGQVKAAGYSTTELATLISHKLAKRLNLGTVPHATVEVTEFRPIFITGYVERSGEYPFSPGMTVLQAISRGGGLFKSGATGQRLEREFLTVSGTYDRLLQERERLTVRKARLEAELALADRIAFPAELRLTRRPYKVEFTASLMAKEQSVFELRRKAYETQVTALHQLQNFLEQEVDTTAKRLDAHQIQIDLLKSELSGIEHLTDRGLATQPRLLAMKRNLAQLEGDKLRLESERTRARQEVSRVKLSKIEFDNKRANELTVELQQTEARLQQVLQEATVTERLLIETRGQAASAPGGLTFASSENDAEGSGGPTGPAITYTIARQVKGGVVEIEANEATQLKPGDTIKVNMTAMPFGASGGDLEISVPGGGAARRSLPTATTVEPPRAPDRASLQPIQTGADAIVRR